MPKAILWLDFETTGLRPTDDILEVAAIVTDNDLNELARFHQVLKPKTLDLIALEPVVYAMHTANGLIPEVLALPYKYATTLDGVDQTLSVLLLKFGLGKGDVRLAGAGVSHFDHDIIKRNLPNLVWMLHYATLDVSVIRRFIEDVAQLPALLPVLPDGNHRAMADVENALAEAKHYREVIEGAVE